MLSQKRTRALDSEYEAEGSSDVDSADEVDISSALTGKKPKKPRLDEDISLFAVESDDDEGLQEIIHKSIAKRNVKSGTELLKKTKGKSKITKGEVGGGSFQSMGSSFTILSLQPS